MKKQEIKDGNKIIALFLGAYEGNQIDKREVLCGVPFQDMMKVTNTMFIESLKYHSDWNWLMPAYAKLRDRIQELISKINKSRKHIENKPKLTKWLNDCDAAIRCEIWGVRIQSTFKGIVETIKIIENNEEFKMFK